MILTDEPTANAHPKIGRKIARLLRRIATEQGRSVIIVSRLKEITGRVLWPEDGQFRSLSGMATDPCAAWQPSAKEHPIAGTTARPATSAPLPAARSSPSRPALPHLPAASAG